MIIINGCSRFKLEKELTLSKNTCTPKDKKRHHIDLLETDAKECESTDNQTLKYRQESSSILNGLEPESL